MRAGWLPLLTLAAALGTGLVAGVFFAFSAFVMGALARLPVDQGVAAMQSINVAVLNSLFLVIFLVTAGICALLAVVSLFGRPESGMGASLAGSLTYLLGTFLVTIAFNVPLNNALESVTPHDASAPEAWRRYLRRWTAWNHVRTVSGLASSAGFVLALY